MAGNDFRTYVIILLPGKSNQKPTQKDSLRNHSQQDTLSKIHQETLSGKLYQKLSQMYPLRNPFNKTPLEMFSEELNSSSQRI